MDTKTNCVAYTDERGFHVLDILRADGLTQCFGRTLDDVRAMHPTAEVMPLDEAATRSESQWIGPVQEITRARYWDMLECLPPMRWKHFPDAETFYMSEFTSGNVTEHFCRIGHDPDARYFCKADRFTLPALDLLLLCRAFVSKNPTRTVQE